MTTKLEDAASIIGEEEAEKIDELAKSMVGKSEALVIKADEVSTQAFEASEGVAEKAKKDDMEHECAEDDEDCKKKMKGKEYEKKALYTVEDIVKAAYDKIKAEEQPKVVEVHPLDAAIEQLKSRYDEVVKSDLSVEDKLRDIQEPFNAVAEVVRSLITNVVVEEKPKDQTSELIKALGEFTSAVNNKLDLITVQLANQKQAPIQAEPTGVPQRRSYQPAPFVPQLQQKSTANTGKGMSIREIVERST